MTVTVTNTYIDLPEEATAPSAPSSGFRRIYFKNDGTFNEKDSTNTETEIGAGGGGGSADAVTYTVAVGGNWTDPDPTAVDDALDQLASRVTTIEGAYTSYTPTTATNWIDPDPTTITGALDDLAERTQVKYMVGSVFTYTINDGASDNLEVASLDTLNDEGVRSTVGTAEWLPLPVQGIWQINFTYQLNFVNSSSLSGPVFFIVSYWDGGSSTDIFSGERSYVGFDDQRSQGSMSFLWYRNGNNPGSDHFIQINVDNSSGENVDIDFHYSAALIRAN